SPPECVVPAPGCGLRPCPGYAGLDVGRAPRRGAHRSGDVAVDVVPAAAFAHEAAAFGHAHRGAAAGTVAGDELDLGAVAGAAVGLDRQAQPDHAQAVRI